MNIVANFGWTSKLRMVVQRYRGVKKIPIKLPPDVQQVGSGRGVSGNRDYQPRHDLAGIAQAHNERVVILPALSF